MIRDPEAYNARRDALSYPPIPASADQFQTPRSGFDSPVFIHGWNWSTTYGRWTALVTFADGWHGWTSPKTW